MSVSKGSVMTKRRAAVNGDYAHVVKATSWYLDATEHAHKAQRESTRGNCAAALSALNYANEFSGNADAYARLLKQPLRAPKSAGVSWGKRRADARDAIERANRVFRGSCMIK